MKKNTLYLLEKWYADNLSKVVLFFIILVVFSLTIVYIPYINIIFPPFVKLLIFLVSWHLIFGFTTDTLVVVSIFILFIGFIATVLKINFLSEMIGEFLYLLLVFIFVNYIQAVFFKKE